MSPGAHPKEYLGCEECGTLREDTDWQPKRRLPQVGQTYECPECGHEAYVYDATEPPNRGENRQWRPVTTSMVRGLLFFKTAGEWPDQAFDAQLRELSRGAAIDYLMVECEGVSQSQWAEGIGVSQQAVSKNVRYVDEELDG
jgi:DNA-directed RNA polymerase subunit RPC12/RpoP